MKIIKASFFCATPAMYSLAPLTYCVSSPCSIVPGYPAMSMYLNQTGRPILFSCEWPYGELQQNLSVS